MKANIVYWYGLPGMPRDGGGLRAIAWHEALTQLGFETSVVGLQPDAQAVSSKSWLRAAKRMFVPMPLATKLPAMSTADLNVVTVPAVFASAAALLPKSSLVFDWMDLWSVNARTMGDATWLSRPGGLVQSAIWARRQQRMVGNPAVNVFAGYDDQLSTASPASAPAHWVPTPITAVREPRPSSLGQQLRVGFIANFAYPPNVMSLRTFFDRYDRAFSSRGIEIVIAGFGSNVVKKWNVNATVLGEIESLSHFYSGIDAAIVPIHHGGGIKAKAVEAMAHGVPLFGTEHVTSGFSPKWRQFIGTTEELLRSYPEFPPVPDPGDFNRQFSQDAFNKAVRQIVAKVATP